MRFPDASLGNAFDENDLLEFDNVSKVTDHNNPLHLLNENWMV